MSTTDRHSIQHSIRALVFDFDGLILDTETPEYEFWNRVYVEQGAELPVATWAAAIGLRRDAFDPYRELEERLGRAVDRAAIESAHRRDYVGALDTAAAMPGVAEYLEDAARLGLKTAVASSSPRRWVVSHLERLGLLSAFEAIKTADDVRETKPDPELYQAAVEALDVPPGAAVALEDSPNGLRSALAAGLHGVAVPNPVTAPLDFGEATIRLPSLADLSLAELLSRFPS